MKNIELLPHNETGYQELVEKTKDNQKVSINRATGTGKSFILLKYLYQNKDKRILYLAPTYPILDQLMEEHMEELGISKDEFTCFDGMIYRNLLSTDIESLAKEYDIIVLDEYHRCGAKLWGKKIHELLSILESKYPNTKVIGATATEIRYLDKERNMNNILFDGVETARLSLADAILEGILPAPLYISYNLGLLEDLNKLEDNVQKYAFYDKEKEDALKELQDYRRRLEGTLYDEHNLQSYLANCKKFLVFSSTIHGIKNDRRFVERILGYDNNSFVVHSGFSKEKNKRTLKEFRDCAKDIISILYSIDILSEGVHVKGADAGILRRPTTSPIIYFQQLGRLLSYSRRKDEIVIVDTVNNIKNHPVIYELYQEVCKRAEELMMIHPENKEHYENILKRFRIVNMTSALSEELDELKKKYSKTKILERRLLRAIMILEDRYYPNEIEKYQAQVDILKYADYITIEIFDRLKNISGVRKPDIMHLSREEFIKILDGYSCIKNKNKKNLKVLYHKIQNFFDVNYRLPSIFSEDEEEKVLASQIMKYFYEFSVREMDFLFDNITDDLSLFERLSYGEEFDDIDYDKLLKEAKSASKLGIAIPHRVYIALMGKISSKELEKLVLKNRTELEFDEVKEATILEEKKKKRHEEDLFFRQKFEEVASKMMEEIKENGIDTYVDMLFQELKEFILKYHKDIDYYEPFDSSLSYETKMYERTLYCKKIILQSKLTEKGYMKELDNLVLEIKTKNESMKLRDLVDLILDFIRVHTGSLPSVKNTQHDEEKKLAAQYSKNYFNLTDELRKEIQDMQDMFPNKRREVFQKYVEFLRKHRRKPFFDSQYKDETLLNEEYNRWELYFTEEEKREIENILKGINKYEAIRNAYKDLQGKRV